ncbi:MAG: LysR family transcriptional regulator [Paucimonas sp.]|nr:LysR family transcriptional regulator [Paucimonas sp.]
MEPIALRYFREVAAHGSVRHAAERMFVAQSAVSRQVAQLESELGVPLFERHARGMALTEAGQLLLAYSNDMRSRFDELRGVIQEYETLRRGHAEIACVEGLLTSFMPAALREFSLANPAISLGVASLGSQAVAEAVAEHRFDLGIVFGTCPRTDLVELARMPQPLFAAVSLRHPLASRTRCTLADLAPYPVVLPDRSFLIRQLIDRACASRKLTLSRMVESNTLAFAQELVSGSDAHVTFLPSDLLQPCIERGSLVGLAMDERSLQARHVTLVASRTRKLSQAARHLAACLAERMKAQRRPRSR